MKTCAKCCRSNISFHKNPGTRDGLDSTCKSCKAAYNKIRYQNNPEQNKANAKAWQKANPEKVRALKLKRYNITPDEYDAMVLSQEGRCANPRCRRLPDTEAEHVRSRILHVDHDHVTGKVRGLLCGSCNRAIGLMKDSSACLLGAAEYLDSHRALSPITAQVQRLFQETIFNYEGQH